ncbi:matrixin family metalloprotease [Paenibacillus chitinolyticus]|uniref:matrixin family metalloprotease n=1 Tax=Paenibacillus chitinolyticus TaxID=79263 RepID=UPI003652D20A
MLIKQKGTIIVKSLVTLTIIGAVLFSNEANANIFSYKRDHGGKFNAWYDSSVSSYGYGPAYDQGRSNWGGITSNVSIGTTSVKSGEDTDEYYVGTTSDPTLLGQNIAYDVGWPVNIPRGKNEQNWDYTTNAIYHNNIDKYSNSGFVARYVTTHEIGHSLGIAHTTGENASWSVMKDTVEPNKEIINTPTQYDREQLKLIYK